MELEEKMKIEDEKAEREAEKELARREKQKE